MGTSKSRSSRPLVFASLLAAFIIGIGVAVGLAIGLRSDECQERNVRSEVPVSPDYSPQSATGYYKYATVVTDSKISSEIGNEILARKGGHAVDAAVAALFATGVMAAHSTGLGGGSFYTIYDKTSGFITADNSETAPRAATRDMFASEENAGKSTLGGLAIGVPGEVKGLYEVHQRFGRVPWKELVMPTVKLCQNGVPLTKAVHIALDRITTDEMKQTFAPYFDVNGNKLPVGSLVKLPKLAATYQKIADDPMSFYTGSLAQDIVADLKEAGAIIEAEDLANYAVNFADPTTFKMPNNMTLYSTPPPGSGAVLSYILNILSGYNFNPSSMATDAAGTLTYHRIIEAMKFAFGKRGDLGDRNFVDTTSIVTNMTSPVYGEVTRGYIDDAKTQEVSYYHPSFSSINDAGTSHISVIDGDGNAVSVTSTINTYFGSKVRGSRTGIVFNNEMDDFSTPNRTNYFGLPASEANLIQPGKRPLSSMCPAIVWDDTAQMVKMVIGAAGGTKITTGTAINIMETLWMNISLPESIDRSRIHHQLVPTQLQVEKGFPQAILNGLMAKGHDVTDMRGWTVVQAALITDNRNIVGTADYRKGGEPSGY